MAKGCERQQMSSVNVVGFLLARKNARRSARPSNVQIPAAGSNGIIQSIRSIHGTPHVYTVYRVDYREEQCKTSTFYMFHHVWAENTLNLQLYGFASLYILVVTSSLAFWTGLLLIDSFGSGADAYQGPSGFAAMHSLMLLGLLAPRCVDPSEGSPYSKWSSNRWLLGPKRNGKKKRKGE